jgi:vacuolar protein sorting-associated protein 18
MHSSWSSIQRRPRALAKMKGVRIESVAWDNSNRHSATTTKEILLGASNGIVWRCWIDVRAEGKAEPRYFKPAHNLHEDMPVSGLYFERFPNDRQMTFVLLTTPSRLYQFVGPAVNSLADVFALYEATGAGAGFHELPGELTRSELRVSHADIVGRAQKFAWLTGPGVYHGDVELASQTVGDAVLRNESLLSYPEQRVAVAASVGGGGGGGASSSSSSSVGHDTLPSTRVLTTPSGFPMPPLALQLTDFHFLLLWPDKLQAISSLSDEIVCEEEVGGLMERRYGPVRGMCRDPTKKTVWVHADTCVFEVIVTDEDRNVWNLYLRRGEFEAAERHAKTSFHRDKVNSARGDHYFARAQYSLAAKFFGKTRRSFEEVTLRFIRAEQPDALKTYLLTKLDETPPSDATQLRLISAWLVELFLNRLNRLEAAKERDTYERVQDEFKHFLTEHREQLNARTVFAMISGHGRVSELLHYAQLIDDYARVIDYFIQQPPLAPEPGQSAVDAYNHAAHNYLRALEILDKHAHRDLSLFYRFCPALMQHVPMDTVNVWIRTRELEPRKLIPSLMRYEQANNPPDVRDVNQAIRYLRFCVERLRCDDPAIHNYLLSLLASQDDEAQLVGFLQLQRDESGGGGGERTYDLEYALRVCMKQSKFRACVLIYGAMELYEEAVELALRVDPELAKQYADMPDSDDELRKKLWLRIARHVVETDREHGLSRAVEFIKQCELLKIEDILPYFPEFTQIDDFKQLICSSLQDYSRNIEFLKRAMADATESANLIRDDIAQLRHKYGFASENQPCDICGFVLLSGPFYIFPCQHAFHTGCLLTEATPLLDVVRRRRVQDISRKLNLHKRALARASSLSSASSEADKQREQQSSAISEFSFASFFSSSSTGAASSSSSTGNDAAAAAAADAASSLSAALAPSELEQLETELDEAIADECLYCGTITIDSIDRPFVFNEEKDEIRAWSLK